MDVVVVIMILMKMMKMKMQMMEMKIMKKMMTMMLLQLVDFDGSIDALHKRIGGQISDRSCKGISVRIYHCIVKERPLTGQDKHQEAHQGRISYIEHSSS